ncbi:MAG: glycosyltransferase family 4 protein [Actinomycetota bacterium]|nr:glycosyltransferase family 4 protein [Actinomycetota bacterium]
MNACTVTIRQRLPYAQVLAESFLSHHPGATFTVLILDDPWEDVQSTRAFDIVRPTDVGFDDLHRLALLLPADELALAAVPHLLEHLITTTGLPELFLADDVSAFANVEELKAEIQRHGIALAARTTLPLPQDDRTPSVPQLLASGLIDSGFLGVSPRSRTFLQWMAQSIRHEVTRQPSPRRGDSDGSESEELNLSRVLDMVPLFFDHYLVEEPGFWVSFWNAWQAELEQRDGAWLMKGRPLKLFRFEGYRPDASHLLGAPQGPRPRLLLSDRRDLAKLSRSYKDRLEAAGYEDTRKLAGGFEELPGGLKIDHRMRALYRRAYQDSIEGKGEGPPDPFDPNDAPAFVDWLNAPDPGSAAPLIPRYLLELYDERLDLQAAYPGVANADAGKYLDWVIRYGAKEAKIPPELCRFDQSLRRPCDEEPARPTRPDRLRLQPHFPFGLNVAGYFKAELGVGEMARLVLSGVEASDVPYSTYAYEARYSRQNHPFVQVGGDFPYGINLICVNADELQPFVRDTGPHILEHRHTIGFWWWELEDFPPIGSDTDELFDELWVGSEHVARAVSAQTSKPVHVVPIPIRRLDPVAADRPALGLPEGFMFLFTFDFLSLFERKNPVGVVKAFTQAFRENEGPILVIKSINGADELCTFELLRIAAADRSDVVIMDGYLPPDKKDALMTACDCYVSLHRAEGYGLGMAEAMALGKPIIATGYSGNLEFLNEENSYLVGHGLVPVPPGSDPYPEGARWAEPDIEGAAELMRRVYENRSEAEAKGSRARHDALTIHTPARTAEFITRRTNEIWRDMQRRERAELPSRLAKGLTRRLIAGVTGPATRRRAQ